MLYGKSVANEVVLFHHWQQGELLSLAACGEGAFAIEKQKKQQC